MFASWTTQLAMTFRSDLIAADPCTQPSATGGYQSPRARAQAARPVSEPAQDLFRLCRAGREAGRSVVLDQGLWLGSGREDSRVSWKTLAVGPWIEFHRKRPVMIGAAGRNGR
jgi:hypothetical protein